MWGPKSWHTDKLIELNTLHYGVIMAPMNIFYHMEYYRDLNLNIVYEFQIILFSKSLIFKLPSMKKITCLSIYIY